MTPSAALRKAYSDGLQAHADLSAKVDRDVHRSVTIGVISESERRRREFALHCRRVDAILALLDKGVER
jgi:hypothetical protein